MKLAQWQSKEWRPYKEEIAEYAITKTTPAMLMNYVNRVERYYATAIFFHNKLKLT